VPLLHRISCAELLLLAVLLQLLLTTSALLTNIKTTVRTECTSKLLQLLVAVLAGYVVGDPRRGAWAWRASKGNEGDGGGRFCHAISGHNARMGK